MNNHRFVFLTFLMLTVSVLAVCAQEDDQYFEKVLSIIETRALKARSVNWNDVRSRSRSMVANASKPSDTYPAIAWVLSQLKDNHSFLLRPDGSSVPIPGRHSTPSRRTSSLRTGHSRILQSARHQIGYVVVGSVSGNREDQKMQEYCRALRNYVNSFHNARVSGWIVDLRGNGGGNMWPMLVGIGQVIGPGVLGSFEYPGNSSSWFYRQGRSGVIKDGTETEMFALPDGRSDFSQNLPVVVLIDGNTASSGEAVAISFRGRGSTLFLGEHTAGLSTANSTIQLDDGANLYLTTSIEADRNKNVYESGIKPDTVINAGTVPLGAASDPVIAAALRWFDTR